MTEEIDKDARDYRVYWQHITSYNSNTYPKQEPLMTLEEAKQASTEEFNTGYLRSYVIDRKGIPVWFPNVIYPVTNIIERT